MFCGNYTGSTSNPQFSLALHADGPLARKEKELEANFVTTVL
jgi:hypothetical protein